LVHWTYVMKKAWKVIKLASFDHFMGFLINLSILLHSMRATSHIDTHTHTQEHSIISLTHTSTPHAQTQTLFHTQVHYKHSLSRTSTTYTHSLSHTQLHHTSVMSRMNGGWIGKIPTKGSDAKVWADHGPHISSLKIWMSLVLS